jgi:hypothetical protein
MGERYFLKRLLDYFKSKKQGGALWHPLAFNSIMQKYI